MVKIKIPKKNNRLLEMFSWLVILFVCVQIFIDNFYFFSEDGPRILGMAIPTLLRYLVVFGLFFCLLLQPTYLKKAHPIFLFFGFVGVYFLIHVLVNRNFHSYLTKDPYSITGEFAYLLRLVMPIIFFFVVYRLKISWRALIICAQFVVGCTVIMLIVSNLSVTSLSSYATSLFSYENKVIEGSIIDWFSDQNLSYSVLATKGWFNYANQLSAYLIIFLPIIFFSSIKQHSLLSSVLIFLTWPAMLMIGTRVALFGGFMSLVVSVFLAFYYFTKEKGQKHRRYYLILVLVFSFSIVSAWQITPYTPVVRRASNTEEIINKNDDRYFYEIIDYYDYSSSDSNRRKQLVKAREYLSEGNLEGLQKEFNNDYKVFILKNSLPRSLIIKHFYDVSYPYENDPDFWLEMLLLPAAQRKDSRFLEIAMIQRVKDINNNPLQHLFGMGITRVQGVFNVERDFISQFYSIGIIGLVLFLSVYPIWSLKGIFWILRSFKKRCQLIYVCCLASISLPVLIALSSGNLMDGLLITLSIAFIAAVCLSQMHQESYMESNPTDFV